MAMTSSVFPQALHMIPRNPTQSSRNVCFSPFLSRGNLKNSRCMVSRVLSNGPASNFGFSVDSKVRRGFIVRAESNPESGAEAGAAEDVVGEVESDAQEEVKAETGAAETAVGEAEEKVKIPRKQRTKLGDIMGVIT